MNIDNAFPSKWLKAADIKGRKVPVMVADVVMEEVGDGMKPVLFFKNKEKGMVLNKTNSDILKDAFGPETDEWVGQKITLGTHRVRGRDGNPTDGLTIEIPTTEAGEEEAPF